MILRKMATAATALALVSAPVAAIAAEVNLVPWID